MKTPEERARIARENGAKSRGPRTQAGKEQSKRNAIKRGERAGALKALVPPHSAVLVHEERREFYKMYDINVAKYSPADEHELAIVREITDLQWSNFRVRTTIHAMLSREVLRTASSVRPVVDENFDIENSIAAYDALAESRTLGALRKEYSHNTRLIIAIERRLGQVQHRWPSQSAVPVSTREERECFHAVESAPEPAAPEGTQQESSQTTEKTDISSKKRVKVVNVKHPLTPEKIRLYQSVFPNRELRFNVYEDVGSSGNEEETNNPAPKAA